MFATNRVSSASFTPAICSPSGRPARPGEHGDDTAARRPLVLGAGRYVAHGVAGHRCHDGVRGATDVTRVIDVRVLEYDVPPSARGAGQVRLALDEHVDEPVAIGSGQLAVDGEPRSTQRLAHAGGVDRVLHDRVRYDELARGAQGVTEHDDLAVHQLYTGRRRGHFREHREV